MVGVPHPVMVGGVGRYPIQSWSGGTPSSHGGGEVPHPVMVGGTPGTPTIQTWDGVPPPRPEMGYPPPRPGTGYPHHPDLVGGVPQIPPTIQTWDGVPPYPDLRWGTPHPTHRPGTGYPPSFTSVDRLKILPSLILRMGAVKIGARKI